MTAPALSTFFAQQPGETLLREVALAAPLPGLGVMTGTVDRLLIAPSRVLAIDYKSNAEVPDTAADTPEGILRQMAAYRAALREIWPGRRVEVAVLWTRSRSLMPLPDPLLDRIWATVAAGWPSP